MGAPSSGARCRRSTSRWSLTCNRWRQRPGAEAVGVDEHAEVLEQLPATIERGPGLGDIEPMPRPC
jgi:hypothetical protein